MWADGISDISPMPDAPMWVLWNYQVHHRPHRVWWTCHFIPDGRSLAGAVHCWSTVTFSFLPARGSSRITTRREEVEP